MNGGIAAGVFTLFCSCQPRHGPQPLIGPLAWSLTGAAQLAARGRCELPLAMRLAPRRQLRCGGVRAAPTRALFTGEWTV